MLVNIYSIQTSGDANLTLPQKGQRSSSNHHLNTLVEHESPKLCITNQSLSIVRLWRKRFLRVVLIIYLGMTAILFNGAEPFEQIVNAPSTGSPMLNPIKTGRAVSGKTLFKDCLILNMYGTQWLG